jgi:Domain of unknown function (DUF4390)
MRAFRMRSIVIHAVRSVGLACAFCCALLLSVGVTSAYADSRLTPLVRDGQLLVSFVLQDGFTEDVRAVVKSGLRTTFVYTVELRMVVPGWIDRTIATTTVSQSAEYDNLTRRHTLQRTIDGRVDSAANQTVEDERVVRDFMTTFSKLALFKNTRLEPNRDYYVRVRARAYPSNGSFLWPWSTGLLAQAKFTFIP